MSTTVHPIDLERLATLLDAYGGDPQRWPEAERDAALALIAASADARRLHDEARRLDALLDALPAATPSPDLEERIVAAARASGAAARAGVAAPDASGAGAPAREAAAAAARPLAEPRVVPLESARAARLRASRGRLPLVATALPLAAAAALALWLVGPRNLPFGERAAAPTAEVVEIQLADLGVYETPSDALLDDVVLDEVYAAEPWTTCDDDELGCLELDALTLDPVSRRNEVRIFS